MLWHVCYYRILFGNFSVIQFIYCIIYDWAHDYYSTSDYAQDSVWSSRNDCRSFDPSSAWVHREPRSRSEIPVQ